MTTATKATKITKTIETRRGQATITTGTGIRRYADGSKTKTPQHWYEIMWSKGGSESGWCQVATEIGTPMGWAEYRAKLAN